MRRSIAISFVILYLVALCRPVAPLLEYYARYEYFSEVLCINKNKPEMKCNGQCILMQKLKKVSEPISAPTLPKISFDDYPIGFVNSISHETSFYFLRALAFPSIDPTLPVVVSHSLFHPPTQA